MNKEYYEDDTPRDYTKYIDMPKEERQKEIARLEEEARQEKKKILESRKTL